MDINFIKMLKIDQNILQLAFASCYPQGMKVVKEVEKQSKFQECVIIPQARTIWYMVVITMKKVIILEDQSHMAFFTMP